MEPILFLCHRIPFPPNKGDKIRSFNLLKELTQHYEVHLGCFIDDPFDEPYQAELQAYCTSVHCLPMHPTRAKIKGLRALLTANTPITLPYYSSRPMQRWVHETVARHGIQRALVFSSSMAQFIEGEDFAGLHRIMDFVDIDSDKWRQYAEKKSGLSRWVYRREYRTLAAYEQRITAAFDGCCFVSPDEAALFRSQVPAAQQAKVHSLLNGVDTAFFDPGPTYQAAETIAHERFIVFTGAMDYWANEDAVVWFVDKVWPQLLTEHRDCYFYIVGGNPSPKVKALANQPKVVVTGRVEDVRPYIQQAEFVVAPLRIARGIQNKVLEALSMNKPVLASSMAMEGIAAQDIVSRDGLDVMIADEGAEFIEACKQRLAISNNDLAKKDSTVNRQWILDHFSWHSTLAGLVPLLEGKNEQHTESLVQSESMQSRAAGAAE